MMRALRVILLTVMLGFMAGCATCPHRPTDNSADASERSDSNVGWAEWMFDQAVRNLLGNLIGWVL
jgi:hypothetical protein